jgi:hypothetical protein
LGEDCSGSLSIVPVVIFAAVFPGEWLSLAHRARYWLQPDKSKKKLGGHWLREETGRRYVGAYMPSQYARAGRIALWIHYMLQRGIRSSGCDIFIRF